MDLSLPAPEATPKLIQVEVASVRSEAQDIVVIELRSPLGSDLPCFTAGSHIDVHLPQGGIRQYSLFNDPCETHRYCIAVLKENGGRGGSAAMHALRTGDRFMAGAPRNLFPLHQCDSRSLLLAGGIGITPIASMAQVLAREGRDFQLHYFVRARQRAALISLIEFRAWPTSLHVDEQGDRPDLLKILRGQPAGTQLYFCGPPGFMAAVEAAAAQANWPIEMLHKEHFAPSSATIRPEDSAFQIRLARSGRVVDVSADQTAADALSAAGVSIGTACGEGVCGSCITRVLSGIPDHRDHVLTPAERAEGNKFTPCCSRALSTELVLDL